MKKGDLVRALDVHKGIGIVIKTEWRFYGLMLVVQWPDGTKTRCSIKHLQPVEMR